LACTKLNYDLGMDNKNAGLQNKLTILESIKAFAMNFPRKRNLVLTLLTCVALALRANGDGNNPHGL